MKKFAFIMILCIALFGCSIDNTNNSMSGNLKLILDSSNVKTIVPDINMEISSYDITGSGPSEDSFRLSGVTTTEVTIDSLKAGDWSITVNATNVNGEIIGTSSTNILIVSGDTTNASIIISPIDGIGTLKINITWPTDVIPTPIIEATLTPAGGTEQVMGFMIPGELGDDSATYENVNLDDGYYTMNILLFNDTTQVWGIMETVRILADQTTDHTFELTEDELNPGGLVLQIDSDLQDPIDIVIDGAKSLLIVGTDMNLSANTSEPVDQYQWYLSGQSLTGEDQSSLVYGSNLQVGNYRFDILVSKEDIVSSNGFPFTVDTTTGLIVADHTVVEKYDQIPQQYIDVIKQMLLCIPGESHGRGYMYGLELLEAQDSRFAVNITWSGEPEAYTDLHLRAVRTYWSGSGWSESGGEEDFYTNQLAIDMMNNHLSYMKDTMNNPLTAFGFGWCWDMTWHNAPGGEIDPVYNVHWAGSSVGGPDGDLRWGIDDEDNPLTGNSVNLYTYINAVMEYNNHESGTITFFTTGPVDGYTGESGYQRYLKHEEIRKYVQENNRVLFDYGDIICWNDAGKQYTTTWDGHTFQIGHPDNIGTYDGGQGGCHLSEAGCLRLGKAMWWMLARIAGWDGTT